MFTQKIKITGIARYTIGDETSCSLEAVLDCHEEAGKKVVLELSGNGLFDLMEFIKQATPADFVEGIRAKIRLTSTEKIDGDMCGEALCISVNR